MFQVHTKSIKIIREWLDDISYSSLNNRMMQFLDQTGLLYPDFNIFMSNIDRINPSYAFIFSVFRLGQSTERSYLDSFLPLAVIDALLETGLLEQKGKHYQMPHVGILPLRGMYFVTGLPNVYPTVMRDSHYKPIDHSVKMMIDEIVSQPVGTDFLEYEADYGVLANILAVRGFKNIWILPKHFDYIPFIQMNLALNLHNGELITDNVIKNYDLIACIHQSVTEKFVKKNQNISDEKDIIQLFPVFRQLSETGQVILLLESVGKMSEITINEQFKKMNGFNIRSIVLYKMPYLSFVNANYVQSSWEKQFELFPNEYGDYVRKTIESPDNNRFIFTQLLRINNKRKDEPFVLYPFYNPKYTDPVFNYASLTV